MIGHTEEKYLEGHVKRVDDVIISKYDSSGNKIWNKFYAENDANDYGHSLGTYENIFVLISSYSGFTGSYIQMEVQI